jgi:hypothetical protein
VAQHEALKVSHVAPVLPDDDETMTKNVTELQAPTDSKVSFDGPRRPSRIRAGSGEFDLRRKAMGTLVAALKVDASRVISGRHRC